jgi:hypothetical protein
MRGEEKEKEEGQVFRRLRTADYFLRPIRLVQAIPKEIFYLICAFDYRKIFPWNPSPNALAAAHSPRKVFRADAKKYVDDA